MKRNHEPRCKGLTLRHPPSLKRESRRPSRLASLGRISCGYHPDLDSSSSPSVRDAATKKHRRLAKDSRSMSTTRREQMNDGYCHTGTAETGLKSSCSRSRIGADSAREPRSPNEAGRLPLTWTWNCVVSSSPTPLAVVHAYVPPSPKWTPCRRSVLVVSGSFIHEDPIEKKECEQRSGADRDSHLSSASKRLVALDRRSPRT